MQIMAMIIVFVSFTLVQSAPSMFYGKQGLEMRKRHGRGTLGVKLFTGVIAFFLAYCFITLFDSSSSDLTGIAMMMGLGCLVLLGLAVVLVRSSTEKELREEGWTLPDDANRDPEDWRIR